MSWFDAELLRAVLEVTTDAVYVKDTDGVYVAMNAAGALLVGRSVEQILGRNDRALFDGATADRIEAVDVRVLGKRETVSYEDTARGQAGGGRTYSTTKGPLVSADGTVGGLFGISRDVQRERLAALGELSAAIAHEIRNPLGTISNAVSVLRLNADPKSGPLLKIVTEEISRLDRIVGDLLDFSRPNPPKLCPMSLTQLLESSVVAALADGGEASGIRIEIQALDPVVIVDERLARRALVNLLQNAAQAMPGGGVITLSARLDLDELIISVTDAGPGVSAAARDRMFEPFFTTKATGTGLGLAIARRIAQDHGGRIEFDNPAAGGGACFRLHLAVGKEK